MARWRIILSIYNLSMMIPEVVGGHGFRITGGHRRWLCGLQME